MRILSRYLLREFATAAAAILAGLLAIWAAADTLLHIDELGSQGLGALRGVALRSLDIVPLGLPMACAIGVTWSLTRAARFREITAIRCGGIPLRRALLPVLLASLLLGVALGFIEDRLVVPAHRSLRGGAEGEGGEEAQEGPRQVGQRWWYARGSWLLSASLFDRDEVALEDVTAFLLGPDHQIIERIDARRARSREGSRWELEDAEVRTFNPDGVALARVPRRVIDIGLQREELASLREPPLMSLRTLWRATFSGRMQGSDAQTIAMELHQRLARPFAILLLVLLAIPFALGGPERGDSFSRALLQCMGVAAAFWALWAVAVVSAKTGWAHPGVLLWSIVALFFAGAALRFRALDS